MKTHRARLVAMTAALTAVALLNVGCAPTQTDVQPARDQTSSILAEYGWDGLTPQSLAETLDAVPVAERPADLRTSITPEAIELTTADGRVETIDLPEDEFYLSFAPYRTQTHDCFFHSPTGCIGELGSAEFEVTITDDAGTTIVDETITSNDNGFIGLWLPRDLEGTLTVVHGAETVTSAITTRLDAPTCLTTLQLT